MTAAFACLLFLLAFTGSGAPSAVAAVPAKGVTGFFNATGQLSTPRGVAVNQTSGNVYAIDGNRVVVFDSSGNLLRAFGADVVSSGPGQANELQVVNVAATAGNFTLAFGASTTPNLPTNATAAAVQSALNALSSISAGGGSVTVSGGPGNATGSTPYRVLFNGGPLAATNVDQLVAKKIGLSGGSPLTTLSVGTANGGAIGFEVCVPSSGSVCKAGGAFENIGGAMSTPQGIVVNQASGDVYVTDQENRRVNQYDQNGNFLRAFGQGVVAVGPGNTPGGAEVQSITVAADSGTFRLSFSGSQTDPLPHNASASAVQAALNALSSISEVGGEVTVSGGPGDAAGSSPYVITFGGSLLFDDQPQISVSTSSLGMAVGTSMTCASTTAAASVTFQWLRNGAPIPGATGYGYTTTAADSGATIQCQVFAINANAGSIQVSNPRLMASPGPATAAPLAPSVISAPAISGTLTVGSNPAGSTKLACTPGSEWTGSPSFTYQWYRNGVALSGNGADTNQYTVQAADLATAAVFQCAATGTNAGGATTVISSNRATSAGPSPEAPGSNFGSPQISVTRTVAVGGTATCAKGLAVASISSTTNFQWLRNGVPIPSATSSTYTATAGDNGATLQCQIFALNANAGSTQVANPRLLVGTPPATNPPSAPTGVIAAPAVTGALTVGSDPAGTAKLTCALGTWTGGPTFTYQWYRNSVALSGNGADTNQYTVQSTDLATPAVFQCGVTGTNAGGATSKVSSARATSPEPVPAAPGGNTNAVAVSASMNANTAATITNGVIPLEVCVAANGDTCKAGVAGTIGGSFGNTVGYPAIAPAGSPNAGNLLVADPANLRVQEFTSAGLFVRTFGFDVTIGGGSGFEVCTLSGECQVGVSGNGSGQFATATPTRIAEDAAGNIYTVEPTTNFRVQKFTLPGNVVTPQGTFAEADLKGTAVESAPTDVAINPATNNVLVNKSFVAGATPACPVAGTASLAESRVVEVSSAGALEGTHGTCSGITPVSGLAVRGSGGNVYVSSTFLGNRIYVLNTGQPVAPTVQITNVSDVGAHKATLNALINPNGPELPYGQETTYKLEYKRSVDASFSTSFNVEGSAGNRTTLKVITASLDGLQPGTSYDVRLRATKPFGSGSASQTVSFITKASAPDVTLPDFVTLNQTAALLTGSVNPNNQATAYRFEYVDQAGFEGNGFTAATRVPAGDVAVGSGAAPVSASQVISGLAPGVTYHYRLVASNPSGQSTASGTFTSLDDGSGCPNASLRSQQTSTTNPAGTAYLPNCMALELATPPKKYNQGSNQPRFSATGDALRFNSVAALAETPQLDFIFNDYVSMRSPSGWVAHTTTPPVSISSPPTPCSYSTDLSHWTVPASLQGQPGDTTLKISRGGIDGQFGLLAPSLTPLNAAPAYSWFCEGGSSDASHLFFGMPGTQYFQGDPLPGGSDRNIYEAYLKDGTPTLELLTRDKNGVVWGGNCGASVGMDSGNSYKARRGAISPDASRVYFTAYPTQAAGGCNTSTNKRRVMLRLRTSAGPEISTISASECTRVSPPCDPADGDDRFAGASQEGDRVFFTSSRQLTNSDLDATEDLYVYDSTFPSGARLTQVSAGDSSNPTPGKGAEVLGVAEIAGDGSHVYFVAKGMLSTALNRQGVGATPGKPNLYLYQRDAAHPDGRTAFIATLESSDGAVWGGAPGQNDAGAAPLLGEDVEDQAIGGDGHILLFATKARVTPDDTDGTASDLYRYDANTGALQRISAAVLGGADNGPFNVASLLGGGGASPQPQNLYFARKISEDGRTIVFSTAEALDPADTDGKTTAYLWRDGVLSAMRGGSSEPIVSTSGDEVAFVSSVSLLGIDGDGATDIYVARAGGGFITPVVTPCTGEACQEPFRSQPAVEGAASESFAGQGNVKSASAAGKTPKCPKGKQKVKRKGKTRCVKPRNANTNRRAGK